MENEKIYHINSCLPNNGQKCLCFGHKTYCCSIDMEKIPDWHEVTFSFMISSYKLKEEIPIDPEESILKDYKIVEIWDIGYKCCDGHVIGVTKWKSFPK